MSPLATLRQRCASGVLPPMMEGGMPRDEDFRPMLAETGLQQAEFAKLGGWKRSTVNRWCRQERRDRRKPPKNAWALLLAYRLLPDTKRRALREELQTMEDGR